MTEYELVSPADVDAWRVYHDIRREVLFEARGQFGVYDEHRPDDRAAGNHAKLLLHRGDPVGVVRIDISGHEALLRRVAIRQAVQRAGHGRALLSLAQAFAAAHGCGRLASHVAPDAVTFYEKCGFSIEKDPATGRSGHASVFMTKRLQHMVDSNVRIRPYRLDDAAAVVEAVKESMGELSHWMPWCHPGYSIDDSRSWLEIQVPAFQAGTTFEFGIVSADGTYLGGCGLNQIDKENGRANLGYWVRATARGRGVATAAVLLLRDWGFQNTDLARFEIVIAVGNAASHRVAEKSGATREGTLRSRLLLHGARHDATMFSFVREPERQNG